MRKRGPLIRVSEMASAKMASAIDIRIDDVGSILKFRIGFFFGENSAGFCKSCGIQAVDTEFPYRVHIVDRGVDCRDPVCRPRFRFPRHLKPPQHFQNSLHISTAGDASFFRSGFREGLSELAMESLISTCRKTQKH